MAQRNFCRHLGQCSMKKALALIAMVSMLFCLSACENITGHQDDETPSPAKETDTVNDGQTTAGSESLAIETLEKFWLNEDETDTITVKDLLDDMFMSPSYSATQNTDNTTVVTVEGVYRQSPTDDYSQSGKLGFLADSKLLTLYSDLSTISVDIYQSYVALYLSEQSAPSSYAEATSPSHEAAQFQSANHTHEEYVKTYSIYAKQGAVVTSFDPMTGDFKYQYKCEACGKTSGGTKSDRLVGDNSSLKTSFTCSNSNCNRWGKSQSVEIGCKVSGEWVTVYD